MNKEEQKEMQAKVLREAYHKEQEIRRMEEDLRALYTVAAQLETKTDCGVYFSHKPHGACRGHSFDRT